MERLRNEFSDSEKWIESQVKILLSQYFSVAQWHISSRSRLVEDLNADSMSVVEIVMIVEGLFDVVLSPSQISEWRFVADIVDSIARLRVAT